MKSDATPPKTVGEILGAALAALNPDDPDYASNFVQLALDASRQANVSDIHLQPGSDSMHVRWRLDGVLQDVGSFPQSTTTSVIARLKVLAGLLTYRSDVPQEGRLRHDPYNVEMRVSTFPTLHGERAVVRLFGGDQQLTRIADLGLPEVVHDRLQNLLHETSGLILVTGPAGSGKTTTLYAGLREIATLSDGARSIVTLEDPVETVLDAVAQSQINSAAGFDFALGLRSLMRQDPEVIMVGEIRDQQTAEVAFQASLTGQLVLSSFHAGSAVGAITRLLDMGIAPYLLRSGLLAIVSQRLVRRLCKCAEASADPRDWLGLPVQQARTANGCDACGRSGYQGRILLCEMLDNSCGALRQVALQPSDTSQLHQLAVQSGMTTVWRRACDAVASGLTSPSEIRRVLGFAESDTDT